MAKSNKKVATVEQVVEAPAQEARVTKSSQIRAMHAEGKSRSEIAKALDIRYQHVRNVLTTQMKRATKAA